MGLNIATQRAAREDLTGRIDRLARELAHLPTARLAYAVDDIRRIAHNHDLLAVETLARSLEAAMAGSSGARMVLPFLEAMSDAVACESADPVIAQSLLASVGLRLHG